MVDAINNPPTPKAKLSRRPSATSAKKSVNVVRAAAAFGGGPLSHPNSSGYTSKLGVSKQSSKDAQYNATPATYASTT